MNCNQSRKYLFAFADGQLSVQANCEVLDHLKMCPTCSRIVDEHQAMREAVRRSGERIVTPPGLAKQVRRAISGKLPAPHSDNSFVRRLRRGLGLMGLAAAIALTTRAAWYWGPWSGASALPPNVPPIEEDPAWIAAMDVVRLHNLCAHRCEQQRHHLENLPGDPRVLSDVLRGRLGGQFAVAVPDLSRHNLEFESANLCCPTEEADCLGAHVMYVDHRNGARFSIFSTAHWGEIDKISHIDPPDFSAPFIQPVSPCDDMTVLAWHENTATYILCGPFDPQTIRAIAADIHLADPN